MIETKIKIFPHGNGYEESEELEINTFLAELPEGYLKSIECNSAYVAIIYWAM